MKAKLILVGGLGAMGWLVGCETVPPGAERGPDGTIAYEVSVEASDPGAKIYANNEYAGTTPLKLKIYGDKDGTFHDFGAYEYVIQAFPLSTNQYAQTRVFRTGRMFTDQDQIPRQIYFDMNQPAPTYVPVYPPSVYYAPPPYYYGPGYYYGPRVYIGPPPHRYWRHRW